MGYKKVNVGGIENLIEFEIGKPVEGVYKGTKDYTAKDGEVYLVGLLDVGSKEMCFFSGGQLKFLLATLAVPAKVKITYLGLSMKEIETKKGGRKKIHQYRVEVDDGANA